VALEELVDHVIGVDPDRDRNTVAVVCAKTRGEVASRAVSTTARGYGQALRWAEPYTTKERRAWSIESTGSYGAGLATALATKGEFVIEFDHPSTRPTKDGAKSDSLDAVRAARRSLVVGPGRPRVRAEPVRGFGRSSPHAIARNSLVWRRSTCSKRSSSPRRWTCARSCAATH
jgi:hypothetical protein